MKKLTFVPREKINVEIGGIANRLIFLFCIFFKEKLTFEAESIDLTPATGREIKNVYNKYMREQRKK